MSELSFLEPRAFWLLGLLVPLLWLPRWSLSQLSRRRRIVSTCLRALTVVALVLALAQPQQVEHESATSTIFLVDVSASMDEPALKDAQRSIERARDAHSQLVTFAREPRLQTLPGVGKPWTLQRHNGDERASDLEGAIMLALGLLEPGRVPQLVLYSDGRETHGDLLRAERLLRERQVLLWVAEPTEQTRPEVGVLDLSVPDAIRVGEPFEVSARVVASRPLHTRVQLLQNGVPTSHEGTRELDLVAGETSLSFRTLVSARGKVQFRLELSPRQDSFVDNNRFERVAFARGAPRVLVVERQPEQAYALLDLLRAARFEVELRTPEHAPTQARELEDVDFYLLSDVEASALSRASVAALLQYVEQGGAFMMAGGERSFGAGGYAGTPLERLLPVSLAASARRDQSSLALMLAIDKSGSMAGEKLERAKDAAIATAALLAPDSYLGVIGFDAQPEQVVRLAVASSSGALARKVGTLAAGGGTAIFPALDAAYGALAGVQARVKHVVLLTDGQTEEESLSALTRSMHADGITLSTIGLGEDVNRGLLSELARLAGGRAYFTRDPSKVPRLFAEEAQLVSRPTLTEQPRHAQRVGQADFLRGVDITSAPSLRGYVSTRARPAPAQLLLALEGGEPLLARMRVGRGWSLAWTADLKPRWAADWFRFAGFPRLLAQLVREHMQRGQEEPLPIEATVERDELRASIEVDDDHGGFVNGLTGELRVDDDRGVSRTVGLFQDQPGRYRATLPLPRLGLYTLRARLEDPTRPDSVPLLASGQVSHPFPAEFQPPFAPRRKLLVDAARLTGGGLLPQGGELSRARGRTARRSLPRWPLLVWLALGLFLLDVAVRRAPGWRLSRRQGT